MKFFSVFFTAVAMILAAGLSFGLMSEADTVQNLLGLFLLPIIFYVGYRTKIGYEWRNLFGAAMIAITLGSCTRIDAGHEGIKVNMTSSNKGVDGVALVTGWQFYNPMFTQVYEFPTFVQTIDYEPFSVNAKDGSVFTVDPTMSIKVIDGHSPAIFVKYRKDLGQIINTTIYNYVRDAFRIQFNSFTTDSVISNRANFESAVQIMLDSALLNEGFHLEQMTSGMVYPPTIVDAIEAKNKAIQDAMRVQNELVKAKANAEIKITEAKAQAETQRLLEQTLTEKLIQKSFIDKWDGALPVYGQVPTMFKQVQ